VFHHHLLGDSGKTIGDVEAIGTVYLVPVPSSIDWYYVVLPFPVWRVLREKLEMEVGSVCMRF